MHKTLLGVSQKAHWIDVVSREGLRWVFLKLCLLANPVIEGLSNSFSYLNTCWHKLVLPGLICTEKIAKNMDENNIGSPEVGMVMRRAGEGICRAPGLISRDVKGLSVEQGHFSSTGRQQEALSAEKPKLLVSYKIR